MRALLAFVLALGFAQADCQLHLKSLQRKLQIAKEYNNQGQIQGLLRAIERSKAHCSNDKYAKLQNDLNDVETFYEGKLDDLKDQIDELKTQKSILEKSDYLKQKEQLERQNRQLKRAYQARKEELKHQLKALKYSQF